MYKSNVFVVAVLAASMVAFVQGGCTDTKPSNLRAYAADDAQVLTHVPFVAEFELACDAGTAQLYAQLDAHVLPVIRVDDNKWLVSWTTDVQEAKAGDLNLNILDEENRNVFVRALGNGDSVEAALGNTKSVTQLRVPFAGAYKGPWLNSELLALGLSLLVAYVAYTSKNALLA